MLGANDVPAESSAGYDMGIRDVPLCPVNEFVDALR